jgi:hypothetical protein
MRPLPITRELQPLTKTTGTPVNTKRTQWSKLAADPDFVPVIAFCAIGFLIALNMMLWFPNVGAIIAQSNLF